MTELAPFKPRLLLLLLWLISSPIMADEAVDGCRFQAQALLELHRCTQALGAHPDVTLAMPDTATHPTLAADLNSAAGIWVKIVVDNAHGMAVERLLGLGIPDAFFLYLFKAQEGRLETLFSLDKRMGFTQRPIANRFLYAEVSLAANGANTFYVYYHTHGKTPLQPVLVSAQKLAQLDTKNDLLNGGIFGVLTILAAMVLFNRQGIHQTDSRNYALLILGCLLFLGQVQGYNFQFLWPEQAVWNMCAPGVIGVGLLLAHALFSISFLRMRQRFGKSYYAFAMVMAVAIASLPFAAYEGFTEWAAMLVVIYAIMAVVLGVLAVRQQVPAAPLYLLGSISLFIFNVLLMLLSIFWHNPFPDVPTFTYPKIAYSLEPILFVAAMINQSRRLNEQKAELRVKRQAETELLIKAERERLAALEVAKHQQLLLASTGHDLSQPLASIRFAMEALRAREGDSPIAQHINTTLDYAQNLIKDLIHQARRDGGNLSDDILLFELFDQLQDEFAVVAAKKGLGLSHVPSAIELAGSALILHRILSNLLANAIRYSHKGRIVFGVRRRPHAIELQVIDTGVGLLAEDCQALLGPFRQGRHTDGAGYGLGLFIVKTLCQQCGYELAVESTPGKGSVFAVKIPIDYVTRPR